MAVVPPPVGAIKLKAVVAVKKLLCSIHVLKFFSHSFSVFSNEREVICFGFKLQTIMADAQMRAFQLIRRREVRFLKHFILYKRYSYASHGL